MAREQIVVGLEIGTSKVCAVVGDLRRDGTVKILGVGESPSRGVRKGEIVDFETASKCVREALVDAEEKSDVMIGSVYLGVTGAHVESFNNRGAVVIPEDREEIEDVDFEEVQANAREVSLPGQNMILHTLLQHYYVDGQDGVLNPIGMLGRKLEADFHVIHGIGNRVKNTLRCVKELDIEVLDVVFNPLAAAEVVLDQDQKDLGALVIDMGGGTTDYIVYVDASVKASGCIGIGGDHLTNDLSIGLRIPMARAEKLKIEEGSALLGESSPGERVVLERRDGLRRQGGGARDAQYHHPHAAARDLRAAAARAGAARFSPVSRGWRAADRRLLAHRRRGSAGGGSVRAAGAPHARAYHVRRDLGFRESAAFHGHRAHQVRPRHAARAAAGPVHQDWAAVPLLRRRRRRAGAPLLRVGREGLTSPALLFAPPLHSSMIELPRSSSSSTPTRLMVLGVGSAGCNMLDRLVLDGLEGAELIAINTDVQSLAGCVAPRQIHIGESITRGLGTGGDPELGHASARESAEEIRAALAGATLVFLLGGLGGGTSSGALPALAQVAREEGAHVVVVATLPFGFEGRRRRTQAEESLAALRASADLLVCFENDRMPEIVAARAGVREAFAAVDVTMSQCVRSLGALAQRRGLLHAGFDEVAALFRQSDQRALFGTAVASGDNRAHEVAEALLRSPLLEHERQMREISSAMIHVAGGPDLTLHEVETFMGELKKHLLADTDLFFGLAVDEAMAGQMSVTVLGAVGQKAAMVVPVPVRPTPEGKGGSGGSPGPDRGRGARRYGPAGA